MVPWSYVGVLDDFAARYKDAAITTLPQLNTHLTLAVLFGDPLLINDGYFLSHSGLREAIMLPEKSPLKSLIQAGFVRVLSRNEGKLDELPDWMASVGITSAKSLVESDFYKSRFKQALTAFWADDSHSSETRWTLWPNIRVDHIYKNVVADAGGKLLSAEPILEPEIEVFLKQVGDSQGRRTEWEDIGLRMLRARELSPITFQQLMLAANESYQYSWGCALNADHPGLRVLTRLPRLMTSLAASEGTVTEEARPSVQTFVPDRVFAHQSVAEQWDKLISVVRPGELYDLKCVFLDTLRRYYNGHDVDENQMRKVAEKYTTELSKHFGEPARVNVAFDLVFVGASTCAGASLNGAPGMIAGLGVSLLGVAAPRLGAHKLLWRLSAPSPKKWLVDRNLDGRDSTVSAFLVSHDTAIKFTEGVPPFRT